MIHTTCIQCNCLSSISRTAKNVRGRRDALIAIGIICLCQSVSVSMRVHLYMNQLTISNLCQLNENDSQIYLIPQNTYFTDFFNHWPFVKISCREHASRRQFVKFSCREPFHVLQYTSMLLVMGRHNSQKVSCGGRSVVYVYLQYMYLPRVFTLYTYR